jgi:hypothetical protein
METRPTSDKEIFVTILSKICQPATRDAIAKVEQWERGRGNNGGDGLREQLPLEEFIDEVHMRLLGQLYDFAQTDSKLSMLLIPIMGFLKKVPL